MPPRSKHRARKASQASTSPRNPLHFHFAHLTSHLTFPAVAPDVTSLLPSTATLHLHSDLVRGFLRRCLLLDRVVLLVSEMRGTPKLLAASDILHSAPRRT